MPESIVVDSCTTKASTDDYAIALSASPCGITGEKLVFSFKNVGDDTISYKFVATDGVTEHTYDADTTLASGADDVSVFVLPWKRVDMYIKSTVAETPGALTGKVLYG
jgi:hypothetical protein